MTDITKQTYKDNLWKFLSKGEGLVHSYYIDNVGVLTLGAGLSVADASGGLRNQAELKAASTDPINQTIIQRFLSALSNTTSTTAIGSVSAFEKSDFKTALEKAGLQVSYELVGENKSSYAISIKGVTQLDAAGKPVIGADGKPVVTDVSNLFSSDQARKGMEAFIANNGLEKKIDTAFGVDAANLTDNQRAALVSVLYNRGPGAKLDPFVQAYKADDEDAMLVAFSTNRLGMPKRVMDDYEEFSGAPIISGAKSLAEVIYVSGKDGNDIVMGFFATDKYDKSIYKFEGSKDANGNYEVIRYRLVYDKVTKTNTWVEVVDPKPVSTIFDGDASVALASLGTHDIAVASYDAANGDHPAWVETAVREMDAQATRLASWQNILQSHFGSDVLFTTRQDGSEILVNSVGIELGRVESGSQGVVLKATDGSFSATINSATLPDGQKATTTEFVNSLAKGSEIASSKTVEFDGGAKIIDTTLANGHFEEFTYKLENGVQVQQNYKVISYSQAERTEASGNVALAGLEFLQALRKHNDVAAAASLIKLVNNAQIASNAQPVLGAVGTGLSGAISVLSALDSWGNASDGERIAVTARAVLGANDVARALSVDGKTGFLESSPTLGTLQGVVALASLDDTLKSKNPFAIASTFMALTNSASMMGLISQSAAFGPQAMIAVAIASIVFGGLFGGSVHYPSPPPAGHIEVGALPDGTLGLLIKDGSGNTYQTRKITGEVFSNPGKGTDSQNWMMGADVLSSRMVSMIADLQAQASKDGTKLILERLPSIEVHAFPSFDRNGVDNFFFAVRFNDPNTGAEQMMAMANQDLAKRFKEVVVYADAVVDATELAQINLKKSAGDAYATETEGQYVDRLSGAKEADSVLTKDQLSAQQSSNRETYSLLTLDLGGDGITRKAQQAAGMRLEDVQADTTKAISRFDADNDGYMELTQWVGAKEAILGIDRNGDGELSSADELFTGGNLSDAAESLGLKRLAFFDANKDGLLSALDPYFKSLKLWLDINADARTGVGEVYSMSDAGVAGINVNTGAVMFTDNQSITLQTTQLTADALGVSVYSATDANGKTIAGQYFVQQEGKSAELTLTADASQDLSEILNLVRPNTNLSDADRTRLTALASKYGVNLSDPAALLALGGGGNMAGTPTSTTAQPGDVLTISQAPNAAEVRKALEAFFGLVSHDPNAGPQLENHLLQATEDTQLKIKTTDLLAGLSGVTLLSVQDARRGTLSRDVNGDVLFSPAANQNGTGYFTYTAQDSTGKQSTGMVWLTIAAVNDAPVAVADTFSTLEDTPLTLNAAQLLANDTDTDIATDATEKINVSAVGNAKHGTVQLVNGQVVFSAEADYQGVASFDYTVSDVAGATSTTTATVTVVGVNDAPVPAGKLTKISAKPDALLRIEAATLLSYAKDADLIYGDSIRLKSIVSVSSGNAWQQKDGSILFKASSLGDVQLTVQIADTQGAVAVVPITINVSTGNSAAAAFLPGPDQATEDTAVRIASTQTILGVVSTLNGATTLDSNGTLVFVPLTNYNGTAQVVYTVQNTEGTTQQKTVDFTVAAVNDAPVVVKQLTAQVMAEDGTLTLMAATLLATVDDVDIKTNGQKLRISSVGDATNGVVALNSNGDVVFNPNKDFNGNATFRYWVIDDAGASVGVWANITVTPVNDAPTPLNQTIAMLEDEVRTFSTQALIANAELVDIDTKTNGDVLRILSVSMAAGSEQKGTVTLSASGDVRFTPTSNYNGQASFVYTLVDAAGATGSNTVTLNIAPVNDAPVAKAATVALSDGTEDTVKVVSFADLVKNFTDVDGDALTVRSVTNGNGGQVAIQNGQVVFTPNKDFAGSATFGFTVSDPSGATASSTATINLANVNDAPVAAYKRIDGRALEDVQLRINFSELTSGAYDADGDTVTIKSVSPVSNSSVWIDWAAQQVVFQGASNFNGVARFNYTLADPSGATSTQAVDVGVIAVNDNPTVRALSGFTVAEDGFYANNQDPNRSDPIRIVNFLSSVGAGDVDGDSLNFGEFSNLRHISSIYRDGNDVVLKVEQNYNRYGSWLAYNTNPDLSVGFNYRVNDGKGGYADAQVNLDVTPQNDNPYLVGLPGWPGNANLGGDFSARIYASDVDDSWISTSNLQAGVSAYPIHGDLSMSQPIEPPSKLSSGGAIPNTWDITYKSHYGDEFSGRVGMNIDVWDGAGGWARQYIETTHTGSRASSGGKPVAIDLNGDGINYNNLDDSKVLFDINGDGVKDLLAWTAADDGLIVFDKNGDGIIQDLDEVSFLSYLTGSMTDLEGLNGFDTNKDGKLSAVDALWSKFGVWQDKNQNGVTDAGEFKGLEAWNIRSIDLKSDQHMDQVGDVYIMGKSTFERTDGTKGEIADTAFRYLDGADTSGSAKPKTFNIDIAGVIRQRLEDAHNHGASDDELRSMLQKFIADVASAGTKSTEVSSSEAVAWTQAIYADPSLAEQLIHQQSAVA